MGNLHIQDVLQRTRHPRVQMRRISPYGKPDLMERDPRGAKVTVGFQALVANVGANLAHHVGVELIVPRPLVDATARARILGGPDISVTQRPGEFSFFKYHPYPVFPGQELAFMRFWISIHAKNHELIQEDDFAVRWRIYADDARPSEGREPFNRFKVVRDAVERFQTAASQNLEPKK